MLCSHAWSEDCFDLAFWQHSCWSFRLGVHGFDASSSFTARFDHRSFWKSNADHQANSHPLTFDCSGYFRRCSSRPRPLHSSSFDSLMKMDFDSSECFIHSPLRLSSFSFVFKHSGQRLLVQLLFGCSGMMWIRMRCFDLLQHQKPEIQERLRQDLNDQTLYLFLRVLQFGLKFGLRYSIRLVPQAYSCH